MDSCGDFVFLVLKTHGVVGGMPCQQNVDEIVKATENWSFVRVATFSATLADFQRLYCGNVEG